MSKPFSQKLREIRVRSKLTQEGLGKLLKKKQAVISAWEKGYYEPNIPTLKLIAKALNCTVSELVDNGRKAE